MDPPVLPCQVCGHDKMHPAKVYRFSEIGAGFGYMILIPSTLFFISLLYTVFLIFSGRSDGGGAPNFLALSAVVSGGIGLGGGLIKKKTVARCSRRKAERGA